MIADGGHSGLVRTTDPPPADRMAMVARRRRKSLFTNGLVLLVAAAALLCFIAGLADVRRVGNAMRHAAAQAAHYEERSLGTGILPLNLEPRAPAGVGPAMIAFEWLATDEAMDLRDSQGPVLAAWSSPVLRLFGADGRAVILFEKGRFDTVWMTLGDFDSSREAQGRRIEASRTTPRG